MVCVYMGIWMQTILDSYRMHNMHMSEMTDMCWARALALGLQLDWAYANSVFYKVNVLYAIPCHAKILMAMT